MPEDKDSLRRDLRLRRRAFVTDTETNQLGVFGIVISRIALEAAGPAKSIACYLANPYEVDAMPIIQLANARGIATALPHIAERDGPMRFLRWQPSDRLVTGPYAIPQPLQTADEIVPDAIMSPLVGFDRAGNRLGQGGGFYDRVFAALPLARRIGLAWSVQEVDALPVDSWDEPLHAVITERERIDFS
jgi:5-formyltetrahydrofolate cyclo-ligase